MSVNIDSMLELSYYVFSVNYSSPQRQLEFPLPQVLLPSV
jgi:hypothetical protein